MDFLEILIFMMIPIIFFAVGVFMLISGIKGLVGKCREVYARCVGIEETVEEGSMARLYKPVFQYEANGVFLTASKVSYDYERDVEIGDYRTIWVEKKHPDVVAESYEQPNKLKSIILIVMGVMFVLSLFEMGIPLIFIVLSSAL